MYASVIKNVSLKYEAGGPRVERFFKEPLSTPAEVFLLRLGDVGLLLKPLAISLESLYIHAHEKNLEPSTST